MIHSFVGPGIGIEMVFRNKDASGCDPKSAQERLFRGLIRRRVTPTI